MLRTARKLTQTELAERSGIAVTSLNQIEKNTKTPAAKTLQRICESLAIPELLVHYVAVRLEPVAQFRNEKMAVYQALLRFYDNLIEEEHLRLVDKFLPQFLH